MFKVIPVEPGDFLSGGESVGILCHVADEVNHLFDIVVSEEVVGGCHEDYIIITINFILSRVHLHLALTAY